MGNQNKIVKNIYKTIDNLEFEGKFRERLEFVKAYENGLNFSEELEGGDLLHYRYNKFLEKIEEENDIKVDPLSGVIETQHNRYGIGIKLED